jgi:Flp pilus assembly protein TadD
LKGKDHRFVLKLKAFWHIKKGQYNEAYSLLQPMAEKNDVDYEAQINLAVIELNTNRHRDARIRLKKLRDAYPADNMIADLLQQLE